MIKSQSPHPLPPPTLPPSPPPPPPPLKPSDTTYKTWMGHQQTTCVQLPQPGGSPAQQVWRWCLRHPQLCRLLCRSLWRRLVVTVKCAVLYTVCRGSSSQIPCFFFWGGGGGGNSNTVVLLPFSCWPYLKYPGFWGGWDGVGEGNSGMMGGYCHFDTDLILLSLSPQQIPCCFVFG